MSPKQADPEVRVALIETAAQLIAEEGSQALSLRRLTRAVGVSTMAVYTHFGSMEDLRRAISEEGFVRLAARMDAVPETDNPVADLAALGWAYFHNAVANPNLYQAMFMEERTGEDIVDLGTFEALTAAARRAIDAGQLRSDNPESVATQLWVTGHGTATLAIAGHLTESEALSCLLEMGASILRSFAADRDALDRSMARIFDRAEMAALLDRIT